MKDCNWKETKLTIQDLSTLLGVSTKTLKEFFEVVENLLVHKFLEEVLKSDSLEDTDIEVALPYLGSLVLSLNKKNISTNFVIDNNLYKKLKKAYLSKESPLTDQICKLLGKDLLDKFEDGVMNE